MSDDLSKRAPADASRIDLILRPPLLEIARRLDGAGFNVPERTVDAVDHDVPAVGVFENAVLHGGRISDSSGSQNKIPPREGA